MQHPGQCTSYDLSEFLPRRGAHSLATSSPLVRFHHPGKQADAPRSSPSQVGNCCPHLPPQRPAWHRARHVIDAHSIRPAPGAAWAARPPKKGSSTRPRLYQVQLNVPLNTSSLVWPGGQTAPWMTRDVPSWASKSSWHSLHLLFLPSNTHCEYNLLGTKNPDISQSLTTERVPCTQGHRSGNRQQKCK